MEKVPTEPKKEGCTARSVLWYLVFVGFAINYMIRINLNLAIVSMVAPKQSNRSLSSECLVSAANTTASVILSNVTADKFQWNERQQSYVLGAFFWLHWLTQIPGGILASKYGTKMVFGFSNFAGVLCCFFIPMAAFAGHTVLIYLRIFQGLLCGFAWPAMHNMTARWIPPNERSKFVTAYLGSSVGAALTYPICGFIIHRWNWQIVFYSCGVVGTIWFIAWWLLVYDSPAKHPRISEEEKNYILNSLGESYSKHKAPVPWGKLLTSTPVWMNMLAQLGGLWGLFTLMTHAPTYFKFIHGWSIQATGVLSGLGHILRMIFSYICGQVGDYLLRTNKMSRTNVRKLATAICTIGQGLFLFALSFTGCNYVTAVILLSAAITMNGSVSAGALASIVDISPNYASIILGLVNTCVAISGIATPAIVGYLTYQNQTVGQWQKVFWIATGMLFGTGIMYSIFTKSELQEWNSPEKKEAEMIPLGNHGKKEPIEAINEEEHKKDTKRIEL